MCFVNTCISFVHNVQYYSKYSIIRILPPNIPLKKNIQQYHINYTLYFWSGSLLQTLKIILDMNIVLKFLKFSEMVEFIYDQLSH